MLLTGEHVLGQRARVHDVATGKEMFNVVSINTHTMRAVVCDMVGGEVVVINDRAVMKAHDGTVRLTFCCGAEDEAAVRAEVEALNSERVAAGLPPGDWGVLRLPDSDDWAKELR